MLIRLNSIKLHIRNRRYRSNVSINIKYVDEFEKDIIRNPEQNIHYPLLLKDCAIILVKPLSVLFNLSLKTSTFSEMEDLQDCNSMQRVYLFSLIHYSHVFFHKFQVDVINDDFPKAFNRLDVGILFNKLLSFGFAEFVIKFIGTYLRNRKMIGSTRVFSRRDLCLLSHS